MDAFVRIVLFKSLGHELRFLTLTKKKLFCCH